jgi:hypothetical protein
MIIYRLAPTPTPITMEQLQAENPRTWFPAFPTAEDLPPFGVVMVQPTSPPPHSLADGSYTCEIVQSATGDWVQAWTWVPNPDLSSLTAEPD